MLSDPFVRNTEDALRVPLAETCSRFAALLCYKLLGGRCLRRNVAGQVARFSGFVAARLYEAFDDLWRNVNLLRQLTQARSAEFACSRFPGWGTPPLQFGEQRFGGAHLASSGSDQAGAGLLPIGGVYHAAHDPFSVPVVHALGV